MALRFRTRLYLTIFSLVFLVIAVLSVVVIGLLGLDMWTANWRAGATMNIMTDLTIDHAIDLPPYFQKRIADQMTIQAQLVAELTEAAEQSGASEPSLTERLNRARMAAAAAGAPIESIVVTDAQGKPIATSGGPPAAVLDTMPVLSPGAIPKADADAPQPGEQSDQNVYAPLPHRAGTVYVGVNKDELSKILDPLALKKALERFMFKGMYGGQYKFMAVVDAQRRVLAYVDRDDETPSPQHMRVVTEFCAEFLVKLPTLASTERYDTRYMGRNVGVVNPVELAATGETYALYIEHDTSRLAGYMLDRLGVVAMVGGVTLVLALITSILLSRGLSKPLIELARGAREFGAGNFNYRLRMKRKDEFSDLAQSFNTMAISIQEYVHELRQETSRRERLESEFRIAAEMQQTLLPEAPPRVEGVELLGWSQPSKDVGGDFYDYFELANGKVGIVLGDATGKGLSAALLSTQCSSILRTLAGQNLSPSELLYQTNNEFFSRVGATHRFVTLFLLVLDPETGMATYASAGHPPAFLTNAGTKAGRWLNSEAGYPLGIVKDATFSEMTVRLDPHDTIVIYSDGVTDAQDPSHQLFGEQRLEAVVTASAKRAADGLLSDIQSAATHHMYGKDPIDDMTIVIVRFDPHVPAPAGAPVPAN